MIDCYGYVNSEKRRKTEDNCGHLSSMYWLYIAPCSAVYQIQRDNVFSYSCRMFSEKAHKQC
jgi:hypothetical protein